MAELTIVTWNIRKGGQKAIGSIAEVLVASKADVIVVTEYKHNAAGAHLISVLEQAGWPYVVSSDPPGKENGVLVVSVYPLAACPAPFARQDGAHRWNDVWIPAIGLRLLGVHVPNVNEVYDKRMFWDWIDRYADKWRDKRALIVGDFNTTRRDEQSNAPLQYSNCLMHLMDAGWTDAWKQANPGMLDYSWFSHKHNGFRLDYVFASPELAGSLAGCAFFHREREWNYSDHSLLEARFSCKVFQR